jgi:hypothetical protein
MQELFYFASPPGALATGGRRHELGPAAGAASGDVQEGDYWIFSIPNERQGHVL